MTRNELIEENMKLVPHVMCKYFRVYMERGYEDDIMGCGYLGLVKAADTWDAARAAEREWQICELMRMLEEQECNADDRRKGEIS